MVVAVVDQSPILDLIFCVWLPLGGTLGSGWLPLGFSLVLGVSFDATLIGG